MNYGYRKDFLEGQLKLFPSISVTKAAAVHAVIVKNVVRLVGSIKKNFSDHLPLITVVQDVWV